MGAASSSDGSPPEELSTRLSTWAAALETAAPELSAALRTADAEAVTRAQEEEEESEQAEGRCHRFFFHGRPKLVDLADRDD